ncbi:MAG: hypothetical protein AAB772_02215 [Patescibacteria group bacterium]
MNFKLIIGLGNPGKEYANSYHNIGHLAVDYFSKTLNSIFYILNSNVYMNNSGSFIVKSLKKFTAKPEELLIIHDDSDIEIGKYKLSFGRGSAGHKGIESIIKTLGSKNFWRLRIGIRPINQINRHKRTKAGDFVLKKINITDKVILNALLAQIQEALLINKQ